MLPSLAIKMPIKTFKLTVNVHDRNLLVLFYLISYLHHTAQPIDAMIFRYMLNFDPDSTQNDSKTDESRLRRIMRSFAFAPALLCLNLFVAPISSASAAKVSPPPVSSERKAIEDLISTQSTGLPGAVTFTLEHNASGELPPCDAPQAFLPNGAQLWGRVSVGIRCLSSPAWTRFVPVNISVNGIYYVSTRSINSGQSLNPDDFEARQGDLTALPRSVITDPSQFVGMFATNRIEQGLPFRRELLKAVVIVKQGQMLKIISKGSGFMVSTEGKAMSNGALGDVVQVKKEDGHMISGILRVGGIVEKSD